MDSLYTFKFNHSSALQALADGQTDNLDYYEARKKLFSLSVMADYDQLVCLPTLTAIDKHWYQIETARKVLRRLIASLNTAKSAKHFNLSCSAFK